MDMDNFKKINDRFGHLVGSRTLIEIAQLLQKNLRLVDIISRYGGDEFVIILPQTPRESSFLVAERLRKVIEKNVFLKQEDYSIRLTASFGVASFPDDARNKEELLDIADKAMFRGKFSTKNIVFEAK
jgi:diguanylate cyclase (GGDEF)-like protein